MSDTIRRLVAIVALALWGGTLHIDSDGDILLILFRGVCLVAAVYALLPYESRGGESR